MDFLKKNWAYLAVGIVSLLLGGLALLTAMKLRQEAPLAPTAPGAQQALEGSPVDECVLDFTIPLPSVTPSATPTACITAEKIADVNGLCGEALVTLNIGSTCPAPAVLAKNDIVLVLDTSSSMDDLGGNPLQPITHAKEAAKLFLDALDTTNSQIGLVTYSITANIQSDLTTDVNSLKTIIDNAQISEGTNTADALLKAQSLLTDSLANDRNPIIVIFSDGVPTRDLDLTQCSADPTTSNQCIEAAINQATVVKQAGTTIYSLILANDNNTQTVEIAQDTMLAIASDPSKYHEAQDSTQLAQIFTAIADSIENVIASEVVVTEILPPGVHYVVGSGNPAPTSISADGQTLTWNIGTVNGIVSSTITFKVSFDSANPDQLVEIFPDSGVNFEDQQNNVQVIAFPETIVDPNTCFASPTPTPTASPTPLGTPSPTPTVTPGATPFATPTPTPTATPIGGIPNILVIKTVNTTTAQPNDVLTYQVRITNNSIYTAYDAYFDENLSDSVDYIAPSMSCTKTDVSAASTTAVGFEIDSLTDGFDTTPDGESAGLDTFRVAGDLTENNNSWDLDYNDYITCTYQVRVNSNVGNGTNIQNNVTGHVDDKNGDQPNETDITGNVTTTVVVTVAPSPTPPAACNQVCSSAAQCPSDLTCYIAPGQTSGYCRVPACITDSDCVCPQATPSPGGPTPSIIPSVPRAGTSTPTMILIGLGIMLLLTGIVVKKIER